MPLGSKAGAKFSVGALAPPLSKHAGPRGSRQPENGVNRSPGHPPRPHSIQSGPLAAEAAPPPPTASLHLFLLTSSPVPVLPFPSPDLPDPGIKLASPAQAGSSSLSQQGSSH